MDNKLVLTITFVMLSWMSVATYAQSNTTTGTTHNMTVTANNTDVTANNTDVMANNTDVMANNTDVMANNTDVMANNTTMMPNNTTMMPNNTNVMANNTTMMPNNTTTAPINMTTALITNTTVVDLRDPLNRTGCGTKQLCASEPSDCDPSSSSSSCFFLGVKQVDGDNFEFSLSGESSGYIATTLSLDSTLGDNDTTYVCANDNGKVLFIPALLNNNQLINTTLPVNSVNGRLSGNQIQCTFVATVQTITNRASGATVTISNGTFSSGSLGPPQGQFQGRAQDLGNVNGILNNDLSSTSTTSTPTTTNHAITFQQSLMQVLLISMGIFTLAMV